MEKGTVAVFAFMIVWLVSKVWLIDSVQKSVRLAEYELNETEAPSRRALGWHLTHIRDDIAALVVAGPSLTNALLAAILAVLVMG